MNLNGDYVSDALAACVGGIGIAPGANINYTTGHALFEATHGTAPKYAGLDKVNPSSLALSGEMLLRISAGPKRPTWSAAASSGRSPTASSPTTLRASWTARPKSGCSGFAEAVVERM